MIDETQLPSTENTGVCEECFGTGTKLDPVKGAIPCPCRRPDRFKKLLAAARIPLPGTGPVRISEGKFWLVNLEGPEGDVAGVGGTGGLLALYWKCPHLGCTVPWNPTFNGAQVNYPGITGWFRCPCHGSTYSRAGVRVFGPAPRPMDTMALTVNSDGSINVNTGRVTFGSPENPLRAVQYNA